MCSPERVPLGPPSPKFNRVDDFATLETQVEQPAPADDPMAVRGAASGEFKWGLAAWLIGGNLAFLGAGIGLTYIDGVGIAGLALSIPGAALATFVVFYTDSRDIRTAITACFVVLYLGFVSASFNASVRAIAVEKSYFSTVFDSFSALMITVIAFYFGGKVVEETAARVAAAKTTTATTPDPKP